VLAWGGFEPMVIHPKSSVALKQVLPDLRAALGEEVRRVFRVVLRWHPPYFP
jgi:hypothetical protein